MLLKLTHIMPIVPTTYISLLSKLMSARYIYAAYLKFKYLIELK